MQLSRVDLLLPGHSDTSPSSELATDAREKDLIDMAELLFFPLTGFLDKLKQTTFSKSSIL